MMGETMQSRENSKSKALKLRLSMVGWSQVGTGLPDPAEECEFYSTWILSTVVPGADLGLWNRPPDHVWTMEWRGLRLRSQRIAEMHPVSES